MRNYKGTSEQYVQDLVYSTNGYHLPKNVEFGIAKHFEPLEHDPRRNDTLLLIWNQKGRCEPYDGHKRLVYRRMFLADLKSRPLAEIELPFTAFTTFSILPEFNAFYGTKLTEADVLETGYLPNGGPYLFRAAPSSLAWQGSISLPIAFDLNDVIANPNLLGFDPAPLMQVSALSGFTPYVSA